VGDREGGRHRLEVEKRVICKVFSLLIHGLLSLCKSLFSRPSPVMH
jgi:hypothetical protein